MSAPRRLAGLLLVLALACTAQAQIKNRVYSLHFNAGGLQPALNDSAQIWLFSPQYGLEAQVMLRPKLGLIAGVRRSRIYNDSVSTSILKFNNDRANRRWTMTSLSLGPKFYLDDRKGLTPFLVARAEVMFWKVEEYPSGKRIVVEGADGGKKDYKATEFALTTGIGFERLIADRFALSVATELSYLTGLGADFAQWVKNSRSRALLQFSAGLSIHFGKAGRDLKAEAEKRDRKAGAGSRRVYEMEIDEPARPVTPEKPPADARDSAIAPTRRVAAVGRDSDVDCVPDSLDKCPDTPAGAHVDALGCPHDSDGDNVLDGLDKCPETGPGDRESVDSFGCVRDSDQDGIPDLRDRCPNTAEHVVVDSTGCTLDLDGDGVANELDQCPDTPRELPVDLRGCPDREKIFTRRTYLNLFNSGESRLRADQTFVLDSLIDMLEVFRDVKVTVLGYTDDVGPDDANLALSQKRADAIKAYFVSKRVDSDRLLSIGRGESNPVASNRTRTGRELNRRIEIEFKW